MSQSSWDASTDAVELIREAAPSIPRQHLALVFASIAAEAAMRAPESWPVVWAVATLRAWCFGFASEAELTAATRAIEGDLKTDEPLPIDPAARCVLASIATARWPTTSIAHPMTYAYDSRPQEFRASAVSVVTFARAAGVPEQLLLDIIRRDVLRPMSTSREWVGMPGIAYAGGMVLRIDGREIGDVVYWNEFSRLSPDRAVAFDRAQENAEPESPVQVRHRAFIEELREYGKPRVPVVTDEMRKAAEEAAQRKANHAAWVAKIKADAARVNDVKEQAATFVATREKAIAPTVRWLMAPMLCVAALLICAWARRGTPGKDIVILVILGLTLGTFVVATVMRRRYRIVPKESSDTPFGFASMVFMAGFAWQIVAWLPLDFLAAVTEFEHAKEYELGQRRLRRAHEEMARAPNHEAWVAFISREESMQRLRPIPWLGEAIMALVVLSWLLLFAAYHLAFVLVSLAYERRHGLPPVVDPVAARKAEQLLKVMTQLEAPVRKSEDDW